ncbi:MAG: ribbon-helix-helix protein, CopG family [Planctomycetes bacterium]|nr:ribbon-helix-helix protein, CopG family [Planctomycetota bacterium]
MPDDDELDARLAALEREVHDERTAAELAALEALREEERELAALRAHLARLQREHRDAVSEVLGAYAEDDPEPGVSAAPRPRAQPGARRDTSVRLDVDLYARLDQLAGEQGRSVQALCADVLDGYMRSRKVAPPTDEADVTPS